MKHPTLSVCLIVRNEAEHLAECLQSARVVADELIVVDTGSTDRSKAVAAELGARVSDFPWCDDFAAARNASLRRATGDYILWLDADDRLDPAEAEKIVRLKSHLPRAKNRAYFFTVANALAGSSDVHFSQMRLFPNLPAVCFQGRIHEQVVPSLQRAHIALENAEITVRHTGYHQNADLIRKSTRNLRLLQAELEAQPGSPELGFQIARELVNGNRREEAVTYLHQVLETPGLRSRNKLLFLEASLLSGRCWADMGQFIAAETCFRELVQDFPQMTLLKFFLSEILVQTGKYAQAIPFLESILDEKWKAGVLPLNLDLLRFQQYYYLGLAYQHQGQLEQARTLFLRSLGQHPDEHKSLFALGALSLQNGDFTAAADYYERVLALGATTEELYLNLATAYQHLGQTAKAETAKRQAQALNPEQSLLAAIGNLKDRLAQSPDNVELGIPLAQLHLERKDFTAAADCLSHFLPLSPERVELLLGLARVYTQLQDFNSLLGCCSRLLKRLGLPEHRSLDSLSDLAGLYAEIGDALYVQGLAADSLQAYRISFQIYPLPPVLKKIFPLASAAGQLNSCREDIVSSFQRHAQDPEAISALRGFLQNLSGTAVLAAT